MPLHLVTGRANAGKTGELNARLFASLERGESPVLVLPSGADTRRAIDEFSKKAPVGVAVVTLDGWTDDLWRLHGDGRRIIGGASRDAFVRRAIADVRPPALSEVGDSPGLAVLVARTLAAMPGERVACASGSSAMRGVAAICARYLELINEAGLIEAAAARRVLGATPPVIEGAVGVNRFTRLSECALAMLVGLSMANDVTVALTWEEGFAPTRALDATVSRLAAQAADVVNVSERVSPGELGDLIGGLYSGAGGVRQQGDVRIGLASGEDAESSLVARLAAQEVASGTPADRVVVAFPRLDAVAHRVESAFAAEGLACDVQIARPVAATSLGRALRGLLTLALGGGDRATAMGVLLGAHSDVPLSSVADIDRKWRRDRVVDAHRLIGDIVRHDETSLGRAAAVARDVSRSAVSAATGTKWQTLVNLLVSASATRASAGGDASAAAMAERAGSDARAARAIVRAIGEMASVEGAPFSASDVCSALHTIRTESRVGERPGHVQITEISRLGSRRFDTVILGGLTAAEWPAGDSDSLADEILACVAPEAGVQTEDYARLEFYQAVSRARNRLALVRREADEHGAPVRPSVLWEEVVDAYRATGEGVEEWPAAGPPPIRVGAADIAESAPVFTQGRRVLRRQTAEGAFSVPAQRNGEITDSGVLALLADRDDFSVTEIEAYLQCPFRWFYERVVRPEEIDTEVDARAVGTVAHSLLKSFYDALPVAMGASRVTCDNVESASELLRTIVTENGPNIAVEGLAEEMSVARAVRWVESAVADDAHLLPGFVPTDHELAFGGPGQVAVSIGGVSFKGRIDRIDRSPEAVFVTDYKSARQVVGHAKFPAEAKIQPVVYALAASEVSGLPIAGSTYRSLRSRRMRGFWREDLVGGELALGLGDDAISATQFEELAAESAGRIESAVQGIRSGRVPREPSVKNACTFCAVKTHCEGAVR